MASDLLPASEVQQLLKRLSYWNGAVDGNLREESFRDSLKKFQADLRLGVDGWYGAQSDKALRRFEGQLRKAPPGFGQARRWRLTSYYVAAEGEKPGPKTVPILDINGKTLAMVSSGDFAAAALEGTIRMRDGRLLNVAGATVKTQHEVYADVFAFAQRNKWIPDKPGYAGLTLDKSATKVVAVSAFHVVDQSKLGIGYGVLRGMPLRPFRTLAADIGYPKYRNAEPLFKGKGGVCPPGTEVFIVNMVGVKCPDGVGGEFVHDGWFIVNDTGGAIYGAHYDVFVGSRALSSPARHPSIGHVWFEGIEKKLPATYSYGI